MSATRRLEFDREHVSALFGLVGTLPAMGRYVFSRSGNPFIANLIAAHLGDLRQVTRIECHPSLRPAFPRMVKARQLVNT